MKKFTVISGNPSKEEMQALQIVADNHTRIETAPIFNRGNWAAPQLRNSMPQQLRFGNGRNN